VLSLSQLFFISIDCFKINKCVSAPLSQLVYKGRFAAPCLRLFLSIFFFYPTSYFTLVGKVTKAPFKGKHFSVFPLKNPLFLISALLPPQSLVIYICYPRTKGSNFSSPATITLRYGSSSIHTDSATNKTFFSLLSPLYGSSSIHIDFPLTKLFLSITAFFYFN